MTCVSLPSGIWLCWVCFFEVRLWPWKWVSQVELFHSWKWLQNWNRAGSRRKKNVTFYDELIIGWKNWNHLEMLSASSNIKQACVFSPLCVWKRRKILHRWLQKLVHLNTPVHSLTAKEAMVKKKNKTQSRMDPSHLSMCGSAAEVGELLADRGIDRSKSGLPLSSAVPRNTSRYGPEPASHFQLIN